MTVLVMLMAPDGRRCVDVGACIAHTYMLKSGAAVDMAERIIDRNERRMRERAAAEAMQLGLW